MRRSNIYLNLPARQSIIVSKLKNNLQVKSVDSIKEIKIISNKNQQNTNHSLNLICQSISSLSELKGYSVDEDVNLNSFKNVLSNALLNIKYADKELYNTLLTIIDTIILIRLPDNIPSHKRSNYSVSFSQGKNIGSIFISFTENDFWLTETLVHEFGHNLLNILMLSKDLIADEEATFYSPWRDEPRPAHGLLHALFSFSYAASLMGKLFVLVNDRSNKEFIKNRLIAHAYRLKFGFEENLQSALTDAGKSVYRIINNYFLTSSCNNFLNSPCPARILEHRNRRVRT